MSTSNDDYEKLDKIGEGSYGKVYMARDRRTGEIVALKKVTLGKVDDDEFVGVPSTTLREIAILQTLSECPHVIRLIATIHEETTLTLVMEYMSMDLEKHMLLLIAEGERLPQYNVKSYLFQLCNGLYHLSKQGVLHRDLKPANLLVDAASRVLKIADLGLGRAFTVPVKAYTHEVVTLWYRAPEVLLGATHYNTSVDIWSVGCIFAEMAEMQALLPGDSEHQQLLRIFRLMGTPTEETWPGVTKLPHWHILSASPQWRARPLVERCPHMSADGLDLLQGMLSLDPSTRIDALSAINHPYFDEVRRTL